MTSEPDHVIHRLAVGDDAANADTVAWARLSDDVPTVVAAALFVGSGWAAILARATAMAATTRDRQLVAIATAHLLGDGMRVDDLARDHLADHPDDVLVAWITSASNSSNRNRRDPS